MLRTLLVYLANPLSRAVHLFLYLLHHKQGELVNRQMEKTRKRLEDYEPGASKEQVLKALRKVATKKKPAKTDDLPPEQASS